MITARLDGIWTPLGALFQLDDGLAEQTGHIRSNGHAAPHGTYLPVPYLRVMTTDSKDGETENQVIDVYDSNANFCRFSWEESADRWNSVEGPITYTIPAGDYAFGANDQPVSLPELTLTRYPTLSLTESDGQEPRFAGKYGIVSLGDGSAPVALPTQSLQYDGLDRRLAWKTQPWDSSAPVVVLRQGLPPLDPKRNQPGNNLGQQFGSAFVVQSQMDQVSASFCGYSPGAIGDYSASAIYAGTYTGTQPRDYQKDNPQQLFNGALVFAFPRYDSYDYVQCTDLPHSPNVPVGLWPESVSAEEDDTHSELVSSTKDQAQAFAVTFGLSAGVAKILKGSGSLDYSAKSETQLKQQSRFTVSRKVARVWVAHLDVPALDLHPVFMSSILSKAINFLRDTTPDKSQTLPWEADFVPDYGTHYAHTITHGTLDLAKTWFTLANEVKASENRIALTASANATLDGFKAGGQGSYSQEWSSKTGLEVSKEDTAHIAVGTPDPVGIFLDLRPLTELMNPIFVPYVPLDQLGMFAPWVWHDVRNSFESYLTGVGLNQPISPDLIEDYRPRRFAVMFPSIVIDGSTPNKMGEDASGVLQAKGSILVSTVASSAPRSSPSKIDAAESMLQAPKSWNGQKSFEAGSGWTPSKDTLSCEIITTGGNVGSGVDGGICLQLAVGMTVTEDIRVYIQAGPYSGGTWNSISMKRATFADIVRVDLPFASTDHGQAQAPVGICSLTSGPYTLTIQVAATDVGPIQ